ncbi:hypothetical protein B0H16DRAFT_1454378 [Mycena metata]|uniref:NB-ARC domain-containing protein n=1 Tax=Mycena metata TaxID=1033252 RepID=A0AAD7JHW4_9AGAR|nr:hypothetical protein B0H16DRAFT_1454378 [Mycena metata]
MDVIQPYPSLGASSEFITQNTFKTIHDTSTLHQPRSLLPDNAAPNMPHISTSTPTPRLKYRSIQYPYTLCTLVQLPRPPLTHPVLSGLNPNDLDEVSHGADLTVCHVNSFIFVGSRLTSHRVRLYSIDRMYPSDSWDFPGIQVFFNGHVHVPAMSVLKLNRVNIQLRPEYILVVAPFAMLNQPLQPPPNSDPANSTHATPPNGTIRDPIQVHAPGFLPQFNHVRSAELKYATFLPFFPCVSPLHEAQSKYIHNTTYLILTLRSPTDRTPTRPALPSVSGLNRGGVNERRKDVSPWMDFQHRHDKKARPRSEVESELDYLLAALCVSVIVQGVVEGRRRVESNEVGVRRKEGKGIALEFNNASIDSSRGPTQPPTLSEPLNEALNRMRGTSPSHLLRALSLTRREFEKRKRYATILRTEESDTSSGFGAVGAQRYIDADGMRWVDSESRAGMIGDERGWCWRRVESPYTGARWRGDESGLVRRDVVQLRFCVWRARVVLAQSRVSWAALRRAHGSQERTGPLDAEVDAVAVGLCVREGSQEVGRKSSKHQRVSRQCGNGLESSYRAWDLARCVEGKKMFARDRTRRRVQSPYKRVWRGGESNAEALFTSADSRESRRVEHQKRTGLLGVELDAVAVGRGRSCIPSPDASSTSAIICQCRQPSTDLPPLDEAPLTPPRCRLARARRQNDGVWTLVLRYGHAAMTSGIRFLADHHRLHRRPTRRVISSYTASLPPPSTPQPIPNESVTEEERTKLEEALVTYHLAESDPDDDHKDVSMPRAWCLLPSRVCLPTRLHDVRVASVSAGAITAASSAFFPGLIARDRALRPISGGATRRALLPDCALSAVAWRLSRVAPIARPYSVVQRVLGVFVTEPSRLLFGRPWARAFVDGVLLPALLLGGVFTLFGASPLLIAFLLNCTAHSIAPVLLVLPDSLWPLFHYLLWQDIASEDTSQEARYAAYAAANQPFAERIKSVWRPGHLLLPRRAGLLRVLIPDAHDSLVIGRFQRGVGYEVTWWSGKWEAGSGNGEGVWSGEEGRALRRAPVTRWDRGRDAATSASRFMAARRRRSRVRARRRVLVVDATASLCAATATCVRRLDLLRGIAAAELVCFQTYSYKRRFISACAGVWMRGVSGDREGMCLRDGEGRGRVLSRVAAGTVEGLGEERGRTWARRCTGRADAGMMLVLYAPTRGVGRPGPNEGAKPYADMAVYGAAHTQGDGARMVARALPQFFYPSSSLTSQKLVANHLPTSRRYKSTPREIDAEGRVAAVAHCPVGVYAERVGRDLLRPGIPPKLAALCALYEAKKISVVVKDVVRLEGRLRRTVGILGIPEVEYFSHWWGVDTHRALVGSRAGIARGTAMDEFIPGSRASHVVCHLLVLHVHIHYCSDTSVSQVSFSPVEMVLVVDMCASQGQYGIMLSLDGDPRSLNIIGGQGGPGGPAHLQGGTGGVGEGPIVHITTSQLIAHNLQATVATDQALQLRNVRASQIASHCPPPSRIFCGRQDILEKMQNFFCDPGSQHIYVLYGLGGAGKTQIALKFINKSSSRCSFSDIFFIDTSTIATIETGLKNIAILKDFGDSPEDGLLWLASKLEEWLLFFDNADDPNINLQDYIPQCNHGNIIITSRNPGMCVYAGSNSVVSDMEEEDAVALLLKSALQKATVRTEQIAAEIVKSLHYLPLAIVQAGAFISKSRNLDGYLALYTKNQARLLSEKPAQSHDRYAWTVYTTWQMSFDRLTPSAAMFLQHCSFLHYNGISEEIFSYASKYQFHSNRPSKEELQKPLEFLSYFVEPTGEWNSLQFLDATNEVQSYSLISFDAEKKLFFIHPLVHSWSRGTVQDPKGYMFTMGSILGMGISERPQWDVQLTSLLLYPHVELVIQMNTKVVWVFKLQYAIIFWEGGRYKQAEKLQEEVLEEQKQLLGENHSDTLCNMVNLANSYSNLGEHQKAKELDVTVVETRSQLLGENHPETLLTMGNLADSYSNLGKHQTAQELNVMVLEKRTQLLGENHPDTLHTMGNLARSYGDLGEHQEAKELQGIVLEKRKQVLGENHPDTLFTMGDLANSYSYLGEHQKAKELQGVVLEKQKQFLGENHPHTLHTMGNLANSYSNLGKHQTAQELNVMVLEKRTQLLGENHPDTLHTMGNLARSYGDLGEHQEAKELQGIVLEKRKQVLGENHPDTLFTMGDLANSYSYLGEHQKAKELQGVVLEKQKQFLGENHPHTLHTMGNLANSYSQLGEYQKAKELEVIVLEKRTEVLGESHPDTLHTMGNLASSYSDLGEHQKAKELRGIVLEKQTQLLGENHPDTLHTMGNLARSYGDLGEHQEAKELQGIVLEKRKQVLGENHPDTLFTMGDLANSYSYLGEHQKAKELQGVVLKKQKQFLGENHPHTLHTMGNLANSYSQLGEYQKAKELEVLVLEKRTEVLGESHPDTLHTMGNLASSYSDLGEHQKAKELRGIVLEKQTQILGENHPDTLRTMGNLANSYSYLGEHQKAKELDVTVVETWSQLLGENHPETLLTMGNLADSYSNLGKHQTAQELNVMVLEKRTQLLDDSHPDTLHTMGNLARSYGDLGEHQEAKELQGIVLEKRKQVLGENHPDTLFTMGDLANSYSYLGEHQKAKELQGVVLKKQKQFLGENHPHTLHTMGNLANSYSQLGEYQKAKELEVIVLEKRTEVLGESHPDTLHTMGNLASSYSDLGEHQKAKELRGIVLEKQTQILGENHPDTLRTMGNLANSYSYLGEHQKAKELQGVVLEKQKQFLGENHPHTLRTMGNLATSYATLGEHQEAKELGVIVLEKQTQVLGEIHPDTLHTMGNLAISYSDLGEHQKAKELGVLVLEKRKQVLGDNHPDTLEIEELLDSM